MNPILLVEDDESLATLLVRSLRGHGYSVVVAPDVESADTSLDEGLQPSIVLLDLNLPGETGWSLLRREDLRGAASPPVVVVSAMTVQPSRLREAGVVGFLPKPFALATLIATIERVASPGADRGVSTSRAVSIEDLVGRSG